MELLAVLEHKVMAFSQDWLWPAGAHHPELCAQEEHSHGPRA